MSFITRPDLGLIRGLDADDYHASKGMSQSSLKLFASPGGPAKYKAGVRKDSRAQKFGGAFHTATLEPHLLEKQYAFTTAEREGTKEWQASELANPGRILLKKKEWDQARRMRDAVMGHVDAAQLITTELEVESSFYWIDPRTGRLCRGRADGIRRRDRTVVDLKSTLDASPAGFAKSISDWGYDWQEYWYRAGLWHADSLDIDRFIFIAIEKEFPHLIGCYTIDRQQVADCQYDIEQSMRDYDKCIETDIWPGHPEGIHELRLQNSYKRKIPFPGEF